MTGVTGSTTRWKPGGTVPVFLTGQDAAPYQQDGWGAYSLREYITAPITTAPNGRPASAEVTALCLGGCKKEDPEDGGNETAKKTGGNAPPHNAPVCLWPIYRRG
jgi:hypothetical protein